MKDVEKRRTRFTYSKYLSLDRNGSGLELLPAPKSYLTRILSFTRFCPEAKRHLIGRESQAAGRTIQNLAKQKWTESGKVQRENSH
jgi:hypothetical protein